MSNAFYAKSERPLRVIFYYTDPAAGHFAPKNYILSATSKAGAMDLIRDTWANDGRITKAVIQVQINELWVEQATLWVH